MTEKITLSGVPETMPQIVYACARESEGRGTIHDPKAEEIIRRLDYDFSLADSDTAMRSGVIARTLVLDRLARSWLAQHPGAVVVNLACGLDTRCCRVDGYAHWYNLDLLETIAVRERLLPEHTLFVITTDGMENASHWYDSETVKRMIRRQQKQYGWEFLFLGANIDAVETARHFGIGKDRAVNYRSDKRGTRLNYEVVSDAICTVRACAPLSADWKEKIEEDYERRR